MCLGLMIQAKEKTIDSTAIMGLQQRSAAKIIHHSSSLSYYPKDSGVRQRKFLIVKSEGWLTSELEGMILNGASLKITMC